VLEILTSAVEVLLNIPEYFVWAMETVANGFFTAVEGLLLAAIAVLPGLPEVVAPPEYVTAINWFFPLGGVLAIATPLVTAYITFLGVRWVFRKVGEL
jgi:hypothetical protein